MAIRVESLPLEGLKLISPIRHEDSRGFFSETYHKKELADQGIDLNFVQDNQSYSVEPGTLRGFHYQIPPFAQDKLVRVLSGRILDVVIDVRRASKTFGKWTAIEISAERWNQLLVPIGFAHAICTLEPDTEVMYKVTNHYSPDHEFGIRWNDPALAIKWPFSEKNMHLSDKDKKQPFFKDVVHWL